MDASRFTNLIAEILALRTFAVVGASRNPQKFGHRVYKALKRHGYNVYAINPTRTRSMATLPTRAWTTCPNPSSAL